MHIYIYICLWQLIICSLAQVSLWVARNWVWDWAWVLVWDLIWDLVWDWRKTNSKLYKQNVKMRKYRTNEIWIVNTMMKSIFAKTMKWSYKHFEHFVRWGSYEINLKNSFFQKYVYFTYSNWHIHFKNYIVLKKRSYFWKFQTFKIFKKSNCILVKIKIFKNNFRKKDPQLKNLRQIEISFALSLGARIQSKSNFNTWRTLSMWHIFKSTWFYQRETCAKRS